MHQHSKDWNKMFRSLILCKMCYLVSVGLLIRVDAKISIHFLHAEILGCKSEALRPHTAWGKIKVYGQSSGSIADHTGMCMA